MPEGPKEETIGMEEVQDTCTEDIGSNRHLEEADAQNNREVEAEGLDSSPELAENYC